VSQGHTLPEGSHLNVTLAGGTQTSVRNEVRNETARDLGLSDVGDYRSAKLSLTISIDARLSSKF